MSSVNPNPDDLTARLNEVRCSVSAAARSRNVCLIAVSKTQPSERLIALAKDGQQDFGENYVQEACQKIQIVKPLFPNTIWHLIGPLQSNKTQLVAQAFDWVHTVDRLKIAQRLSDQRPADLVPLNVLIQVNIDQETSKSGVLIDEVANLAQAVAKLPQIRLRGLMCIPEKNSTDAFKKMSQLLNDLNAKNMQLDCLSMGMSHDYQDAIVQGATHVRIGTAIFGARST